MKWCKCRAKVKTPGEFRCSCRCLSFDRPPLNQKKKKKNSSLKKKHPTETRRIKQPRFGAFNTESSQEEASADGGGGIGDLVAHLLLGGQNSPSSLSPSRRQPCPPSAPLRDASGACVQAPSQACSSAQPRCASCDPSWKGPEGFASCLSCEEGSFAFSSAYVFGEGDGGGGFGASTAGARSCLQCAPLLCGKGGCVDGTGCAACPEGLRLERRCASCPLGCV